MTILTFTGDSSLAAPGADRIAFWDETAGTLTWLSLSPLLEISGTTLQPKLNGALVKLSGDQTSQNFSSFSSVSFGAEEYDTGSFHDNSTNPQRLTVTDAGYYQVAALLSVVNLAASDYVRAEIIRFNSSSVAQSRIGLPTRATTEVAASLGLGISAPPSAPISCSAGDYFVVQLDTEADTSIDLEADETWFGIWRVA